VEESIGFGLTVQLLPNEADRAAVLGQVAGLRNKDRHFRTNEVDHLFSELRLPNPSNLSRSLGRLVTRGFVVRHGKTWALTPTGERRVQELVGDINPAALAADLAASPGAMFADERHTLIPPSFAPARWRPGIARLLKRFPFETNVFLMSRFQTDHEADPLEDVVNVLRSVLSDCGLTLLLASEHQFEDDILGNVGAHMWASQYGIGLLENRMGHGLNYNAVIELGSMIVTGRSCTLLRDPTAPELPTDLASQIYKPVDFDDLAAVTC
jgi:hypothetical protein